MTSTIRSRSTISPMTIVVVREEPAGSSWAGASAFVAVADFGDSAVAGAPAAVVGAPVDAAAAAASAGFGAAAGLAVDCENATDETRKRARVRAVIARGFMTGETIGRTPTRQAGETSA